MASQTVLWAYEVIYLLLDIWVRKYVYRYNYSQNASLTNSYTSYNLTIYDLSPKYTNCQSSRQFHQNPILW